MEKIWTKCAGNTKTNEGLNSL